MHFEVTFTPPTQVLCDFPGGWYNFDDSRASGPVPDSEIVSSSAYVLFYRRREEAQKDDGTRLWESKVDYQALLRCLQCPDSHYEGYPHV